MAELNSCNYTLLCITEESTSAPVAVILTEKGSHLGAVVNPETKSVVVGHRLTNHQSGDCRLVPFSHTGPSTLAAKLERDFPLLLYASIVV